MRFVLISKPITAFICVNNRPTIHAEPHIPTEL